MGTISGPDLLLLRQPIDLQKTVERLYCFGMPTLWTGRINDATIARGERSIDYNGGAMAAGFAFADLQAFDEGLEVWFSEFGYNLKDRGVRRLRSIGAAEAAGTLVCDWYDDMALADDDYITIVHNYPAWPKYSWFTATGPEFRKDGPDGTLYAASGDANETPAPHVIVGRHYANELPTAGTLDISFDASNTVDVAGGGGAPAYAWDITPPGSASFDNTAIAAPTLTVTAEGRWWVHCTVTIDGRSTTAHRAVIVGGGVTEFERSPITTQWDSTSLECQITSTSPDVGSGEIRPDVDWSDFEDHALIIITADDWYGATNKSIDFRTDGVYDDRHHVVFCGYLLLENDDFQSTGAGQVQMSAVSLMDMFIYSLSLTGVTAASQWYEMSAPLMTVAGNLLHLFRWHSTLLDISDWWLPWADTVRRSANEEFGEGNIIERARALCRARIMGMTINPQGEVFIETDLNVRTVAERLAETTTLTLTEADISGDKRVRIRRRGDVIRVLLDSGYSQGRMGTFQPYFSASQEVASAEGRPALVHLDRLMLPSQAESNRLAGRLAGIANRKYSEVNLEFSGNYREIFSPADQQWTDLGNIFGSTLRANLRGYDDLENVKVVPREVTHSHDNRTGQTGVSAIFDVEAPVELVGVTITPPEVPSEDPGSGTWDPPGAPEWPAIPEITFTGSLVAFDLAEGCWVRLPDAADWEERNGARGADDNDVQGGWDPHWFCSYKQNSTDPNKAILIACQTGKIWRSTDCGQNWLDATPDTDPPDDFGQTPAPTAGTVTYVQRTDNIHINKTHYFAVEYYDGALWGGWLLVSDDDCAPGSYTWYSLKDAAVEMVTDGTYYYPVTYLRESVPSGEWDLTITNPNNMLGFADDSGARFDYTFIGLNGYGVAQFDVDFGGQMTVGAAAEVQVRTRSPVAETNNIFEDWMHAAVAQDTYTSPDDITYTLRNAQRWDSDNAAFTWGTARIIGACTFRYLRLRFLAAWFAMQLSQDGEIDAIRISDVTGISGGGTYGEIRPIWMDVDSEDGSVLYMTAWADDDHLHLWKFDTSDFTAMPATTDLGACTIGELFTDYVAYPHTPPFDKDYVYIFGRMNSPSGLANPEHVIISTDGAVSFASVENGWGADICGAFRAEGDTNGARMFYAARNVGGAAAELYAGMESLIYRIDLPFAAGVGVYVDALTITPDGIVAVGADTAGASMIQITASPWSAWTDITDSYPLTGSVSSLTYL